MYVCVWGGGGGGDYMLVPILPLLPVPNPIASIAPVLPAALLPRQVHHLLAHLRTSSDH